jgi:hypothetical protein
MSPASLWFLEITHTPGFKSFSSSKSQSNSATSNLDYVPLEGQESLEDSDNSFYLSSGNGSQCVLLAWESQQHYSMYGDQNSTP